MGPPVTPSPHRFLAGQRRDPSPTKTTEPTPAPTNQYRTSLDTQHATQTITSSQFAPTPRFGKTRPSIKRLQSSPPKPMLAQALRASLRTTDAVQDTLQQDNDEEMLDTEQMEALPTTEREGSAVWTNAVALSPKRRKVDPGADFSSPDRQIFKQPDTPASHFAKAVPRVLPSQTHESISSQTSAPTASRPAFRRSSVAPSEPAEPLPDAFSPHRRGQKYVPGGMASTTQQWVIETGQAAVLSRKGQGYLKGEDYVMRAKVDSLRGDGPHVAKARLSNGDSIDLIMAGTAHAGAARQGTLSPGCTIGVRAPSWNLELDRTDYVVAVDWRVLP